MTGVESILNAVLPDEKRVYFLVEKCFIFFISCNLKPLKCNFHKRTFIVKNFSPNFGILLYYDAPCKGNWLAVDKRYI